MATVRYSDWFAWASAYARAAGLDPPSSLYRIDEERRVLFWCDREILASPSLDGLLAAAEWYVMSDWADRLANRYSVCHAAAVEHGGGALLLIGGSGSGKSTMAAALVQRGFRYLGDEIALIQARGGTVVPFPRSLCIKQREAGIPCSLDRSFIVLPYPEDFSPKYKDAMCCLARKEIVSPPGERFSIRWLMLLGETAEGPPAALPGWQAARVLYQSAWKMGEEQFRAAAVVARRTQMWKLGRESLDTMADRVESVVAGGAEADALPHFSPGRRCR